MANEIQVTRLFLYFKKAIFPIKKAARNSNATEMILIKNRGFNPVFAIPIRI